MTARRGAHNLSWPRCFKIPSQGVWYPHGTVYQPLERDLGLDMSYLIERNTVLLSINGSVREIHDDFIINAF